MTSDTGKSHGTCGVASLIQQPQGESPARFLTLSLMLAVGRSGAMLHQSPWNEPGAIMVMMVLLMIVHLYTALRIACSGASAPAHLKTPSVS